MAESGRATYRSVLGNREFSALLASQALSTAGDQLARIAVAILVYGRTGSGLLASATYAVSYAVYLTGGPWLSALADRYPRRTVMITTDLARAPVILLLCLPHPPLWLTFGVLGLTSLLAPAFDSARSGLQPEILKGDAYVTGNALMNLVLQFGNVSGFLLGGAIVSLASVRGALALDAASFLFSAAALRLFLQARPPAQAPEERSTLRRDTAAGFAVVRSSPALMRYLTFALIGSAALITPEGLAVPIAHGLGGHDVAAGVLTASVPAGFVLGGLLVLRIPPAQRLRLLHPLTVLTAAPLLVTPFATSVLQVALLWALGGLGGCLQIVASSAYMQACPTAFRSRAFGVATAGLNAVQGACLLAAGALADLTTPRWSVAAFGALTLLLLVGLPSLRRAQAETVPQGVGDSARHLPR